MFRYNHLPLYSARFSRDLLNRNVVDHIGQKGEKVIDLEKEKFEDTVRLMGDATVTTIFFQPTLQAQLWTMSFMAAEIPSD